MEGAVSFEITKWRQKLQQLLNVVHYHGEEHIQTNVLCNAGLM